EPAPKLSAPLVAERRVAELQAPVPVALGPLPALPVLLKGQRLAGQPQPPRPGAPRPSRSLLSSRAGHRFQRVHSFRTRHCLRTGRDGSARFRILFLALSSSLWAPRAS